MADESDPTAVALQSVEGDILPRGVPHFAFIQRIKDVGNSPSPLTFKVVVMDRDDRTLHQVYEPTMLAAAKRLQQILEPEETTQKV